jgi:ribonuclease P/MRP protein subunit RPP1
MRRRFADLHLLPKLGDDEQTKGMLRKASELGYHLVAVPLSTFSIDVLSKKLMAACREVKVDFASRLDLKPKTPKELLHQLREFRRKVEIIAVACWSKDVARQAAKDHRVDILNFPSTDPRERFFDKAEAELASNSLAALEIDIKPLLTLRGPARIRFIAALRREVAIADEYGVPIVISSGATNPLQMRKPMDVAGLTTLFDMDKPKALNAVSKTPFSIVERNREKLSPNFIAPGIRIIRQGSN